MALHKDCFAFCSDTERGCAALNELICKKKDCKFYKTDCDGKYQKRDENEN